MRFAFFGLLPFVLITAAAAAGGAEAPGTFGQGIPGWVMGVAVAIVLVFAGIPISALLFKAGEKEDGT